MIALLIPGILADLGASGGGSARCLTLDELAVIARTSAVGSREQALALKGRALSVSRAAFPAR